VLENSIYKLHYDRSITTDRTVHNNTPYVFLIHQTTKDGYLIDVVFPKNHKLHSTITQKLQMYTDLKQELIRTWQLKTDYTVLYKTSIVPPPKITRKSRTA